MTAAKRIRETLRAVEAEARVEREVAVIVKEGTGYPAAYIARRERAAASLEAAAQHLRAALQEVW